MLMIEKKDAGIAIEISGDAINILTELGVLIEVVQAKLEKVDVYSALNDPIQRCLASSYLKAIRSNKGAKI